MTDENKDTPNDPGAVTGDASKATEDTTSGGAPEEPDNEGAK